ncbi:MAG: xanthine dehydrogenase family protein molybdopterin-binding subunit [Burkholderiales bacterium]|nr:xanthine dehydrogenase family protein molybdopterin-binding subunit [Burkholderiales bacterium]
MAMIDRRAFIVSGAAGGFALGFGLPAPAAAAADAQAADAQPPEVNAWVVIRPDETVVIRIARSEMGQGTLTGLAQLVAEELECDWSRVTTEFPTPGRNLARDRVWGDFGTGGSRGIRASHDYVRKGGAAARLMLVQAAAEGWGVPAGECSVERGVISHSSSQRSTSYGQVAAAAARLAPPSVVPLKDPSQWKLIGRPLHRLDTRDKLTGAQVYGIDLQLPGLLNAAIRDCPVAGGKLVSYDAAQAAAMPGVQRVLRVGDSAVAVVAQTWWQAKTALEAVHCEWDGGVNAQVSSATIAAQLAAGLDAAEAHVYNQRGDVDAALAGAAKQVEAVYRYPYQNHATMEPMNATALVTADRCEVWCPTQNGEAALAAAAAASGLPAARCDVYKLLLGGGFGRRGFSDYVTQAVLIARELPGTPVKLIWSREEDMTHGRYHPVMQARLRGAIDAEGRLSGLRIRLSGQSILASMRPAAQAADLDPIVFQGYWPQGDHGLAYTVPNLKIDHAMRNPHVPPGFWRGVNINQNAIFLECFIDELAEAAGVDALEFRRRLMAEHPLSLAVLNAVAERGGWGRPTAPGHHLGLAHFHAFGSHVAACAEVSVDGHRVKVHRIVGATDCGYAVNPAQIERQIAGSFVYGLSALFMQACTVKDGAVEQRNFDRYDSMRIAQMPQVETIVMPSGGFWGGVGEPTICVAAPAVLNAITRASGRRIRSFPLEGSGLQLV